MKNKDYSTNYYTDPKVTHPTVKIDVPIPHVWESVSYSNDISPSFTHKGLQIFVMDEQSRLEEKMPHKYSIMYVDTDTHGYDLILTSNIWDEVLDFVKQYQPSN